MNKNKEIKDIKCRKLLLERKEMWEEKDQDLKINILKNELHKTQTKLSELICYVNKLIDHQHLDNGKMVKIIEHPNSESYGGFHSRDSEWWK